MRLKKHPIVGLSVRAHLWQSRTMETQVLKLQVSLTLDNVPIHEVRPTDKQLHRKVLQNYQELGSQCVLTGGRRMNKRYQLQLQIVVREK